MFTLSSLTAGLAYFPAMLIAARACQGFGAALLSPATLTILVTDLKGRRRSRAIGAWASTSGVGGGLGVFLGGLMTQELSWRWVFIINVPVGVITFAIAWTVLGHDPDVKSFRDLDLAGAVVITAAMVTLIFTLIHAGTSTWASTLTIATAIGAVLLFTGFWQIESRLARFPLIPPGTLRGSVSIAANVTVLLLYCVVISPWFLLSYYMQTVLGYGPLRTGLAFLPQAVVIALTSNVTSRLAARHDPRAALLAGPLLAAVGLLVMWRATLHGSGGYLVAVLCPLILLGLAIGCTLPSATILATASADPREAGFASGMLNSSLAVRRGTRPSHPVHDRDPAGRRVSFAADRDSDGCPGGSRYRCSGGRSRRVRGHALRHYRRVSSARCAASRGTGSARGRRPRRWLPSPSSGESQGRPRIEHDPLQMPSGVAEGVP